MKMRGKNNPIMVALMMVVVGLVLFIPNANTYVGSKKAKLDFNTMQAEDFTKGIYVKGEINEVNGSFMNYTVTRRGEESIEGYMYLVPIYTADGQVKYLGVYTAAKDSDEMEVIYNLTGTENWGTAPPVIASGKIKAYNDEELEFLYSYLMEYAGYTSKEECNKDVILYYVDYESNSGSLLWMILGGGLSGIGLIVLVVMILFVVITSSSGKKDQVEVRDVTPTFDYNAQEDVVYTDSIYNPYANQSQDNYQGDSYSTANNESTSSESNDDSTSSESSNL